MACSCFHLCGTRMTQADGSVPYGLAGVGAWGYALRGLATAFIPNSIRSGPIRPMTSS
jgi:hypothetical protein